MKKSLFLCLMALVGLFAGCKKSEKTFTVGFDADFPPFGFKDAKTGEYRGFDLDLAAEVCERNGWKLVKRPIDWAAKDSELNAGTIDCIWNGFTMNEERKDKYTWSEPYVKNQQLVIVKKGSNIKKLSDLNGKIVVSQDGSSGAEAIKGYLEEQKKADPKFAVKELKLVPDYMGAAMMLRTGAVDAIALDSAVADQVMDKAKEIATVLEETVCDELYGIGFKLGNTALRDTVQKTLKDMVKDGTVADIVKHWATQEKENGGAKINFILSGK